MAFFGSAKAVIVQGVVGEEEELVYLMFITDVGVDAECDSWPRFHVVIGRHYLALPPGGDRPELLESLAIRRPCRLRRFAEFGLCTMQCNGIC